MSQDVNDNHDDDQPTVHTDLTQDQLDAVFAPLYSALTARDYSDGDVFDLIASALVSEQYALAFAMTSHVRDIVGVLDGDAEGGEYNAILAEMYRRTFFDLQGAARYGTGYMIEAGLPTLESFVEFMVTSLAMDDAQAQALHMKVPLPVPDTRQ